jgi:hypothetical protein
LPKLDEIGKTLFEEETPPATHGALTFHRQAKSPISSAEVDGVLLCQRKEELSSLPAPWCFFPKDQGEVLLELKMRGDKTDKKALKRALLQRQAWEFHRYDQDENFQKDIPLWFVSAHLPVWLSSYLTIAKVAQGCYKAEAALFDLYFIASNELPLEEALFPFLVTRDGAKLEGFFEWLPGYKGQRWVVSLLVGFSMPNDYIQKIISLYPDDPESKAQRAALTEAFVEQDPALKEKLSREAKQEGKAEGVTETLKHLVALKLGRALSAAEEVHFQDELLRLGTDAVSKLLLTTDKRALSAWLKKPTTPSGKKATGKKTSKSKKGTH